MSRSTRASLGTEDTASLPRRVHLLGVGGAGLSGAARLLVQQGHVVSGHDGADSSMLAALRGLDVAVRVGGEAVLPADVELVVRSAAVPDDDPQVREAVRRGLPVLKYADLLPLLVPAERGLAVAGTHGKTTTAWMLWYALEGLRGPDGDGPAPGALIGGLCRRLETNAMAAEPGGWFAVEACEYDRSFLRLAPRGAAVTNVEGDHLDYYGSLGAVEEAFARFAAQVHGDGLLVLGRDVPACVENAASCTVWRLGRELEVDLSGERRGAFRFRLRGPGWSIPEVSLAVPGSFNVENAALALALAVGAACPRTDAPGGEAARYAASAVGLFNGAGRRFDPWGSIDGVDVVHDYAHHPTEVRVTIEAARRAMPGVPVHVLFQPHQHSRTARFLAEFAESLRGADRVVVTEVYGARRHTDGARFAGAPDLVSRLRAAGVDAVLGGELQRAVDCTVGALPRAAGLLVLGAGDVEKIKDELLSRLAVRRSAARRPVL